MNPAFERMKNSLKNVSKDTYIKIGLFLIPLIGIVLKGIFLQGFIQNKNPYDFSLSIAFSNSQYTLIYYLAFTLIFLSFGLLFKGKGRIIYFFIIDALLTALTLLDAMYFRGFLTVPSVMILTQTANLDNLGGTVLSMLSSYDFIFFIDFIVLGIYVFLTRKIYKKSPKRAVKTFFVCFLASLLYIGYIPFNLYILDNKNVSKAYLFDDYDPTNTVKYFSPVGYHIMDLITVYKDSKPYEITAEDKEKINSYYSWKNEDLQNNEYSGISKGKNLLVIQVESLESFVIGKEINGQKITPVMDNIINHGLYFPNIYEQVNEGTSSDCDLMINTSLLPLSRGSTFFRYPNTNYNSLPKILASDGYNDISIHPDKGSFWNYSNALTGGIGFENFVDYFSFNVDKIVGMGISDRDYFQQVVPMLQKLSSPFYAHTITLTNHGPFDLPDDLRELKLDPELDASELGGYFQSVHYTDAQIGYFLELLDKAGILDNTLVVITGDHTGVHKYYNSSIEKLSSKEDWYLDDGEPRVPLIIYDKGLPSAKTFNTIGGQIDIMPTMLYMLGVDKSVYENTALGRNLLNTNRSFAILTNRSIRGENLSDEDKKEISNSLDISDKIIRGNYFNDSNNLAK